MVKRLHERAAALRLPHREQPLVENLPNGKPCAAKSRAQLRAKPAGAEPEASLAVAVRLHEATSASRTRIFSPTGTCYKTDRNLEGTDMMNKETVQYGRFTLKSRAMNGKARAAAFVKDQKILECEAADTDAALASVKAALDAREETQSRKRREPHIGTVDDYTEAFSALSLSEHERLMLHAHANSEGRTMTETELARADGRGSYRVGNSIYGTLGKKVAQLAGWH